MQISNFKMCLIVLICVELKSDQMTDCVTLGREDDSCTETAEQSGQRRNEIHFFVLWPEDSQKMISHENISKCYGSKASLYSAAFVFIVLFMSSGALTVFFR